MFDRDQDRGEERRRPGVRTPLQPEALASVKHHGFVIVLAAPAGLIPVAFGLARRDRSARSTSPLPSTAGRRGSPPAHVMSGSTIDRTWVSSAPRPTKAARSPAVLPAIVS